MRYVRSLGLRPHGNPRWRAHRADWRTLFHFPIDWANPSAKWRLDMTLTCSGLTVGYGGPDVVKDVNLRLSSGQVTALIGPNGCGKSTLLKTLGRQLTPSAGAVYLAD